MRFNKHINESITGWPSKGRYVGLVIDEMVANPRNDWKLYLPMVEMQVGDPEMFSGYDDAPFDLPYERSEDKGFVNRVVEKIVIIKFWQKKI